MSKQETVRVRILLVVGSEAEVTADTADSAEPERYPVAEIAEATGLTPSALPGKRLLADVGVGDRLMNWRLP